MARRNRLTFNISRTLLTSGLVATAALGAGCVEDVTSNPFPEFEDGDAGRDATDADADDPEDSVNPDIPPDPDVPPDEDEVSVEPDAGDTDDLRDTHDEFEVSVNPCFDEDGDGFFGGGFCAEDCDDFDATVHPNAEELCDGRDNDCDGAVDEDFELGPDGLCTTFCTTPGATCDLAGGGAPCCNGSTCQDLGEVLPAGEGVCCLTDGTDHTQSSFGGDACCNKDLDGDGLCGP